jgi:hypothetical protein
MTGLPEAFYASGDFRFFRIFDRHNAGWVDSELFQAVTIGPCQDDNNNNKCNARVRACARARARVCVRVCVGG